jgi:hypothetical protein
VAADQRGFQHRGGEGVELMLQQQAASLRDLGWRQAMQVVAAQSDAAGAGRAQSGQAVQQRGLAGTVAPEDRQAFAGGKLEAEVAHQGLAADFDGETFHVEPDLAHVFPMSGWRDNR